MVGRGFHYVKYKRVALSSIFLGFVNQRAVRFATKTCDYCIVQDPDSGFSLVVFRVRRVGLSGFQVDEPGRLRGKVEVFLAGRSAELWLAVFS